MPSRSHVAVLALLATSTAHAQLPPDKAARTFTVSPGLEFKLWASEPLFANPTCMDIDHLGRVWVCESVNYRNKLRGFKKLTRPEGDRIVILEDSKGTGVADKATTFYQHPDLLAPLGIAVAKDPVGKGYKVYVCQSPDILVFEDKDGDGKADGPPTKLLTGFKGYDHDHGVHGLLIGPDRRLYFSVGDAGVAGLQSSDGKGRKWTSNSTDCRAGTIWRCDLDGKNLELIAHNFRNQYEPCVDSFGNIFVSDNDDDGNQQTRICHVLPGGNYGYHPRGRGETHWHEEQPGVVPMMLRTYFGSPTGMCVYEGTLLPKKYWGQPLHTDAGPRHLRAYHLKPAGATFAAEQENIVQSSDNWFRPSDVCVAPDGSVFVADWYDPGVGGHGMGDIKMGRVYRLAPVGHKYAVPKVDLDTVKGYVGALGSPNLAVRHMAMTKMQKAMESDQLRKLFIGVLLEIDKGKDLPQKTGAPPILWSRLCWLMANVMTEPTFKDVDDGIGLTTLMEQVLCGLLEAKDPRIRVLMARISERLTACGRFPHPPEEKAPQMHDLGMLIAEAKKSPADLREALVLLRNADPANAKKAIYTLMKNYDGKDRHYLAAIGIAVGHHDEKRREVILADFDKHFPEWNDKVADLVWELRPPKMLPRLGQRLKDAALPAEQRARVVDILAASADPAAGEAVLELLAGEAPAAVRDRAVENLRLFLPTKWQKLRKAPALDRAVTALLEKPATREVGLALIAAAERADQAPAVKALASNKDEPAPVRRAALRTLGQLHDENATRLLAGLLTSLEGDYRLDALKGLGEVAARREGSPAAKRAVRSLGVYVTLGLKLEERQTAVAALAAGQAGTAWLLEQHAKKNLPADMLDTAGRLLRNSPYQALRNKALQAFPAPGKLDLKKLPPVAALATMRGDASRGKKLLADSLKGNLQCLKCHTVRGVGGQVGPDLSMIGKKASRENLFESILYPSKAVADQYVTWTVETVKGVSVQGLLVEETADAVILRDAEGRDTRIAKKDIENRAKSPKSLMPEDVIAHLQADDLVDLVEHLFTLKTAALAVDRWHVAGPFDNGKGMDGLDRAFGPEKAVDLAASYDGKHGKVTWREVKPDAAGYVDLKALHDPKSANTVSYLTREVVSPADQPAVLLLGTDDGAKLWLNGDLVFTSKQTRHAAPEQDRVEVTLRKGTNKILLKINNGDGPHGFYFTLLSEQEVKLGGKK